MGPRTKIVSLLFLGGVGLLGARAATLRPLKRRAFPERDRPLAFAHRGGQALRPENTIYAFAQAAKLGVQVLELDVHLTRDGEVVVHHDDEVDRTSDGHGAIAELTFSELRRFDFGAHFDFAGGESPGPLEIPTLREIFESFPGFAVNIDIKVGGVACAQATAQVIERAAELGGIEGTPHVIDYGQQRSLFGGVLGALDRPSPVEELQEILHLDASPGLMYLYTGH